MSCGEISAFYTEFEQFMEFYWSLCCFCSQSMWRKICGEKICVEKKWQIWGLGTRKGDGIGTRKGDGIGTRKSLEKDCLVALFNSTLSKRGKADIFQMICLLRRHFHKGITSIYNKYTYMRIFGQKMNLYTPKWQNWPSTSVERLWIDLRRLLISKGT